MAVVIKWNIQWKTFGFHEPFCLSVATVCIVSQIAMNRLNLMLSNTLCFLPVYLVRIFQIYIMNDIILLIKLNWSWLKYDARTTVESRLCASMDWWKFQYHWAGWNCESKFMKYFITRWTVYSRLVWTTVLLQESR